MRDAQGLTRHALRVTRHDCKYDKVIFLQPITCCNKNAGVQHTRTPATYIN